MEDLSPTRALLSSPGGLRSMATQNQEATSTKKPTGDLSPAANRANFNQQQQQEETTILNGQPVKFRRMFNPSAAAAQSKRDEDMQNGAVLSLEHSFGFQNQPIYKNTHFISEDTIVYPSGRHLSTFDLVNRRMDFIKREDSSAAAPITAMQVGLSRKKELVVAIAEKPPQTNAPPRVSIYIPSRLRWFRLEHDAEVIPQITSESVIEQIYLPNYKKYCITLTRPSPSSPLIISYFRYEKEKLSRASEVKPQVRRVTVNPKNHYQFLGCGRGYLKMWDASDKQFRETKEAVIPAKYEKENDFIECIYIQENVFVTVSSQNNFFIVENAQVKYYINISFSIKNSIRNLKPGAGATLSKPSDGLGGTGSADDSDYTDHFNPSSAAHEDDGTRAEISAFAAHKKGFIVGSKNGGYLGIYEIERDFSINHVDTFKVDPMCSEVTSVAVSFDRQYLLINALLKEESQGPKDHTEGDQDFYNHHHMEMYFLNLHQLSVLKNVFTLPIKPVFPKGNILGGLKDMSVGVSKDLIVTVGEDKHIRVFEYAGSQHSNDMGGGNPTQGSNGGGGSIANPSSLMLSSYNQLSAHRSKEQVYCIAIHPMGLQIAAGFKDKLKIFYLLEDEVRPAIDFQTKLCYSARYSNGGQYLAAANNNVIWILDPYTFELKFQLHGHPSPVKRLQWNESDSMLLSVCQLGSGYGWFSNFEIYNKETKKSSGLSTKANSKKPEDQHAQGAKIEIIMKGVVIHAIGYDEEYDLLYVSSSDNKLQLFSTDGGKSCKTHLTLYTGPDLELTSLLLGKQQNVLFAGTNKGSIRVYLWPMLKRKREVNLLQQSNMEAAGGTRDNTMLAESQVEYMEYQCHLGPVTNLSLSSDRQSLLSSSEDGTLFVHSIREMCNGFDINVGLTNTTTSQQPSTDLAAKRRKNQLLNKCKVHLNMNSLSLVVRQAIEQKNAQIQELKYKVDNLKSFFQGELQNIADKKSQEINKLNEKNTRELEEEKQRYKLLQEEHENERNYLLKTIENNLEAHKKELKEINDDYQLKLKNAYKQHDKLVEAYEESKMSYKKELEAILDKNKEALEQIEKEYRLKYEELQKNHIRLINDMKRDGEKFDVALEQCEQEYEKELLKRRDDFSTQMNKLSKQYDDLREEHEKLQRERETMRKKLDDCEEIQYKLGQEQEQFHRKILDSNTRLVKMQEQLGEREDVIKSKEKSIKDLRNVNTHLENFRFVLDHKIRSLKDEKLPMEEQIANLEKHIKQMYQELLDECEKKKDLMEKLKASEEKLKVLKDQLKEKSDEVVFNKRKLELLQYDLGNLIRNESLDNWPEKVSKLYEKHFEKRIKNKDQDGGSTRITETTGDGNEEEVNIKDELIRQNNWMNNKLKSIMDKNAKLEKEKKDLYLKIQKENSELILECNLLRGANQKISKKVEALEKKLKDISGISLSNANLVENQLEGFLKKAAPLSTKHKETPFMQLKNKTQNPNRRNQMLMDYYNQYASANTTGPLPQQSMMLPRQPGDNLEGLISEMEKNQTQIQMQNYEIQQLQERVTQFLRQPSDAKLQQLPPIQGPGLGKSESQPLIGFNADQSQMQQPSGMSLTMRKDDSTQKSLYKYPGQSTTISQATLMTSQQISSQQQLASTFTQKRKDSRSKQL